MRVRKLIIRKCPSWNTRDIW